MAQTYLTKTSPTAGNRTKGTISCWFKRSALSSYQWIYSERLNSTDWAGVRLNSDDTIGIFSYNGGSAQMDANTTAKFRDTNGWYHLVANWDTSLATASDRVKIWINGELQSFSGSPTYPSQDVGLKFGIGSPGGSNYDIFIGRRGDNAEYFDGSMSHFHRVDNQALAPTVFGSTDSTTGEWKISTTPSITYTGSSSFNFFILKDGNSVTDQSGESNNLTVGYGTLTKTEDCPDNVFATLNPLVLATSANFTLANGNTSKTTTNTTNAWRSASTTIGASSGKYYFEVKVDSIESSDQNNFAVGITDYEQSNDQSSGNGKFFAFSRGYGYHAKDGKKLTNDATTANGVAYGSSWTTNDIIGCAFDLDNGKIYWSKNGTWQDSGDPTRGSTGTGSAFNITTGYTYFPVMAQYYGNEKYTFNFGNGYFGTTAVSSAGTNASNNGIFEYDVPTGYTALSTKGLNL